MAGGSRIGSHLSPLLPSTSDSYKDVSWKVFLGKGSWEGRVLQHSCPGTICIKEHMLTAGHTIPEGSSMTCYLRDRNQPGAVDGGLCIPHGVPNVASFCSELTQSSIHQASVQVSSTFLSYCCSTSMINSEAFS